MSRRVGSARAAKTRESVSTTGTTSTFDVTVHLEFQLLG
jgi:hypothetical protein